MKDLKDTCRIAVVQAGPVMFNKDATIEKACKEIIEAGNKGAELIVFPESYIPCYPFGLTFGFTVGNRDKYGRLDWKVYYDNSVVVPSEDTDRLADAAAQAGAYVSIGITERSVENATLYCTNLIFGPDGALLARHRDGLLLFLFSFVHSNEDAEELLMDTFAKLAVDKPSFHPRHPGSFKSWLYAIGRNNALMVVEN